MEISRGTWIRSWNSRERLGSHDYVMELRATGLGEVFVEVRKDLRIKVGVHQYLGARKR